MLKTYPDFKKERIDASILERQLNSKEVDIVNRFVEYCAITAGERKCRDIRSIIFQIRHIVEKDFCSWKLEEVRKFLSVLNRSGKRDWTTQGIKIVLKRFIKWHYKDWSARFNNLEDVRLKKVSTQDKYTESSLLTKKDIELLIRSAETLREKAMIITLFETACRPQELCNLRWKDLRLDDRPPLVTLYSRKTRESRTFPLNESVVHLKRWRQEWCFPTRRENDYVFPGRLRKNPVSTATLSYQLKRIAERANLEKNLFAYLFRHSKGSELYDKLPEQQAKMVMGHNRDSSMVGVYAHGTNRTAIQAVLKEIYNVEEIDPEQKPNYDREIAKLKRELGEIRNHLRLSRKTMIAATKAIDT